MLIAAILLNDPGETTLAAKVEARRADPETLAAADVEAAVVEAYWDHIREVDDV